MPKKQYVRKSDKDIREVRNDIKTVLRIIGGVEQYIKETPARCAERHKALLVPKPVKKTFWEDIKERAKSPLSFVYFLIIAMALVFSFTSSVKSDQAVKSMKTVEQIETIDIDKLEKALDLINKVVGQ